MKVSNILSPSHSPLFSLPSLIIQLIDENKNIAKARVHDSASQGVSVAEEGRAFWVAADTLFVADINSRTLINRIDLAHVKDDTGASKYATFTEFTFDKERAYAITVNEDDNLCIALNFRATQDADKVVWVTGRSEGMESGCEVPPLVTHGLVICYYYYADSAIEALDVATGDLKWKVEFDPGEFDDVNRLVFISFIYFHFFVFLITN